MRVLMTRGAPAKGDTIINSEGLAVAQLGFVALCTTHLSVAALQRKICTSVVEKSCGFENLCIMAARTVIF